MNVIYSQFSDIGEYFDATKSARDFGVIDWLTKSTEGPSKGEQEEAQKSAFEKVKDFLTDEEKVAAAAKNEAIQREINNAWLSGKPMTDVEQAALTVPKAIRQSSDAPHGNLKIDPDRFSKSHLAANNADPFIYKAPGSDPVTVNAVRNADPQIYNAQPSTPTLGDWLGKIDPTDGVLSNAEILTGAGVGTAAALALGLGIKKHLKNKKELKKAQEYFREHPKAKKAAGFSEKDSNRVLKTMAGALGGGALGYLAGIPLNDLGLYDVATIAPLAGGALGASKVLAADAKRADSGELINKKIQDLKSRLPEETYSKKLDKIAKKYTDEYGFTPETGSIKDSLMKREELRVLKKASKSERRNSPEYIKQKEERKNSAKGLAKAAGKGMGAGIGIGAGVGAGFGTIYDALYYGGRIYPEEVGAGALLGSVIGAAIGPGVGAIKHVVNSKRIKSPDKPGK